MYLQGSQGTLFRIQSILLSLVPASDGKNDITKGAIRIPLTFNVGERPTKASNGSRSCRDVLFGREAAEGPQVLKQADGGAHSSGSRYRNWLLPGGCAAYSVQVTRNQSIRVVEE